MGNAKKYLDILNMDEQIRGQIFPSQTNRKLKDMQIAVERLAGEIRAPEKSRDFGYRVVEDSGIIVDGIKELQKQLSAVEKVFMKTSKMKEEDAEMGHGISAEDYEMIGALFTGLKWAV